jgi:hypothetical protein
VEGVQLDALGPLPGHLGVVEVVLQVELLPSHLGVVEVVLQVELLPSHLSLWKVEVVVLGFQLA